MNDLAPDFLTRGGFMPLVKPSNSILDQGKTPAEWIKILSGKGVTISERSLRSKANDLGARIKIGRSMLITDEHMEIILKDAEKCRSSHTSEALPGGRKAESNTKASPSQNTTNAALEHLQNKLRGAGAKPKSNGRSASTSSGRKTHQNG